MSTNDGGAAFPVMPPVESDGTIPRGYPSYPETGMSLRDYFAAKAMAALISTAAGPAICGLDGAEKPCAASAYRMADAMLAERTKDAP